MEKKTGTEPSKKTAATEKTAAGPLVLRPADRAGWLAERARGIGSSEIAAVLGLSPWETPYGLWRRKRGMDAPPGETPAMRMGHALEDAVARIWAAETGLAILPESGGDWLWADPGREWMRASPDRLYRLPGGGRGVLECKTTRARVDAGDLPRHWFCQLQWQLGVGGLERGSIAWLASGRDFGHADMELSLPFFEWMASEARAFWEECVIGGREPELRTAADVAARHPRHADGKAAQADAAALEAYGELTALRDEQARLEKRRDELEGRLKMHMGDAEALVHCGTPLCTWRAARDGEAFDAKRFRKDHPELAAAYTVPRPGARRFLLK